jgi:DNA-directed RNA polymerase specialized sigma24 family protein
MKQFLTQRTSLYATDSDFCRIFRDDMSSLYMLSYVLTADHDLAEKCFVSGLDDCSTGNRVFKEWARSWARRVVIKDAIRMIAPGNAATEQVPATGTTNGAEFLHQMKRPELAFELKALIELPPFERFAFVMSFCEGYADRDCALLLGCTRDRLVTARTRALEQIKDSVLAKGRLLEGSLLPSESAPQAFDHSVGSTLATSA